MKMVRFLNLGDRGKQRRSPTLYRNSGDVEISIDENFKAFARPSMAGCYSWGITKSDVNIMPKKIRPRKARKHQKQQRARPPLDLKGIDIDAILQQIIQEEAYSSKTSDTSTFVELDQNRRDQSLAIAGLQKDSQQQRTVNREVKEKEETITLQPSKGSPPIISDYQGKNVIMLGKTIQEMYYQDVRLAGGVSGIRNERFVKGKKVKNVDIDKIKNAVITAIGRDGNISLHDVSNNLLKNVALNFEITGHDESIISLRLYWKSNTGNIRENFKQTLQSNRDEELNPILEDSPGNNNMVYRKTSKRPKKEKCYSDNCVTVDKKQKINSLNYLCRKEYDQDAQYMCYDKMKGMQNESDNCWFNSAIQSFIRIPQLQSLIISKYYDKISYGDVANDELLKIMQKLLMGQGNILPMSEIKNAYTAVCDVCSFKYNEQQDAYEFISKAIFPFLGACKMLELFSCKFCLQIKCLSCGATSCRTDSLPSLSLHIPDATFKCPQSVNIQDIIDIAIKGEQKVAQRCNMCKGEKALLKREIIQSPEVMMFQLQRALPCHAKIHTRVNVKENVDVITNASNASYQLVSVIQHHGQSASRGHYSAMVFNGKRYFIMDDENCLEEFDLVNLEKSAYIAIYHKTDELFQVNTSNGIGEFPEIILNGRNN